MTLPSERLNQGSRPERMKPRDLTTRTHARAEYAPLGAQFIDGAVGIIQLAHPENLCKAAQVSPRDGKGDRYAHFEACCNSEGCLVY